MATKVSDGIKLKPRVGFSDEAEDHQSEQSKESHHKKSKGELRFSLSTEKRYDNLTDEEELKLRRARLQQRRGTRYDCYGKEVDGDEDNLQGKRFHEKKNSDKSKQATLPDATKSEPTKCEEPKSDKKEINGDVLKEICKEKNENTLIVKEDKIETKEEIKKEIKDSKKGLKDAADEENKEPVNGTNEEEEKELKNGPKQVGLRKLEVKETKNN